MKEKKKEIMFIFSIIFLYHNLWFLLLILENLANNSTRQSYFILFYLIHEILF